jgi:hypothetical protein
MAFQSGEEPIGNGDATVTVAFVPAFDSTPPIIIAVVQNQTDNPQLRLNAQVTSKDENGFTVDLDGTTDSANYELAWIAGDADLVFQAVTKLGTRISDLPQPTRELRAADRVVVVQDGITRQVPFLDFQSAFMLKTSTAPSAASDAGVASTVAFDANAMYLHTGSRWLRIPYGGHPTDWTIPAQNSTKPAQGGRVALADEATEVTVVYDAEFPSDGGLPQVFFALRNIVDVAPTAFYGNVTASSLTGFTVTFSEEIDSSNWVFDWFATQY